MQTVAVYGKCDNVSRIINKKSFFIKLFLFYLKIRYRLKFKPVALRANLKPHLKMLLSLGYSKGTRKIEI
jgi:hypothetical protein